MLVLITDIFGRTKYVESLANALSSQVEIIDPYQGETITFENEAAAYRYFIEQTSVEAYAQLVYDRTQQLTSKGVSAIKLLGFSIGASAVWLLNDNVRFSQNHTIDWSMCFYGSQIRHATHLKPNVKTIFVFPQAEQHFDVTKVITALSSANKVELNVTSHRHGFMNPLSVNYNKQAYLTYIDYINARL